MSDFNGHSQSGFSLLEMVFALAAVSLVLAAVYQAYGPSIRGAEQAERRLSALLSAESKISEIGASGALREGIDAGVFDSGQRWRTRVSRHRGPADSTAGDGIVTALEIEVGVWWGADDGEGVVLKTVRLVTWGRDE